MGAAIQDGHYDRMVFALTASDDDVDWLARACAQLRLRLSCYDNLVALTRALAAGHTDQVILLTEALPPGQSLADVLSHLRRHGKGALRVLCFARTDDLQMRLDARRGDCVGFHLLPMDEAALAEALAPLGPPHSEARPRRILVVDDVRTDVAITAHFLRRAGFEVRELTDELAIMDSIRDFRPELILMDLNMPKASGTELTAIIRDHGDLLLTPIVFLSGEQDAEAQREALRLGADEFLSKPAEPRTLVDTVRARLQRSQGIQRYFVPAAETDAATGLLSRRGFLRRLDSQLAAHGPEPGDGVLCLSIDNAEAMLKTGGSGAEDLLLSHVGNVLRDAIGPGDSAARFDQYKFTLLVLRPAAAGLMQIARKIAHKLGDKVLQLGNSQQRIALSIGVTRLADRANAVTHISRAQSACLRAREQSPGRIAQHGADSAAVAASAATATLAAADQGLAEDDPLAEAIVDALVANTLEPRYRPLMPVSERVAPARRFALEAWLPAQSAPDAVALRLDHCGDTSLGELRALLDYWLLEQAISAVGKRQGDPNGTDRAPRLRLFVPQAMATLRGRRWVFSIRDRLLELGPHSAAALVVTVQAEDVLAHLGVANTIFPLLARLRLRVCATAMSTQPAALSLLEDYPIIAFVEPSPAVVAAPPEQGTLEKLIRAAHARKAQVVLGGVDDARALSRAWHCGADLATGDFVQPASTALDFDFGADGSA